MSQTEAKVYAVAGAGRQGVAAAYDLARFGAAREVRIFDREPGLAARAAARVNALAGREVATGGLLDATDESAAAGALRGADAILSAVPYFLNPGLARAAIAAGASFCDLGGNTRVVEEELALDAEAKARGISIVPDCGLAPGMVNTLAAHLIERVPRPRAVAIRVGGLPQRPQPPLGYQIVFAVEGLLNEYSGNALVLRGGKVVEVPALEEPETIEFPPPVGRCEAFTTSGGASTCPLTYQGRLEAYDYKTVRYPGHLEKLRLLGDLGLLDLEPVEVRPAGTAAPVRIAPRSLLAILLGPRLSFPGEKDLVVMRVTCRGEDERGAPLEMGYEMIDFFDERTGLSAMERTTAFPAAIVCAALANGLAPRGAVPLERAIPGPFFLGEIALRGLPLTETVTRALAAG